MASQMSLRAAVPQELTNKFPWRFIFIAFGISWTCWFFVALTGRSIFTDLEVGIVAVLGGFGPAIAGIIMVYRTNDQAFIRDYWRRVFDPKRIRAIWFVPIVFLYPATVLLTFVLMGVPIDASPLAEMLRNPGVLVTTVIFVFIFGPFSEELGWRDYALDWLQARYSALVSSVILGVIWWAWHLPLLAVSGSFLYENGSDPVFLMGYLYVVIIYSVLFTWVYNNNARSVLAIILLHFSINLTSRIFVMPSEIFTYNSFILIGVLALVLWRYGGKHLVRGDLAENEVRSTTVPNKPPALWRWFMKAQNPFMKWLLRSPLDGFVNRMYLLISVTGRKSGQTYTTPVQYAQDGDRLYIITSEGYTWWKNLRGGADIHIHLRGKTYAAHADTSTDPQTISNLLAKIYPGLSAERRQRFVPGKVAITVRLQNEERAAHE